MKKYVLLIIAISVMAFQACKKDEDIMNNNPNKENRFENVLTSDFHSSLERNVLHFESSDSLLSMMSAIIRMTDAERNEWEAANNFKSFYSKSNELLEIMDTTSINSINNFVNTNSDYFYLSVQDGETYLSSYYDESLLGYLLNPYKIVSVADNYYKVFNEGYVVASEENKDYLYMIDSFNSNLYVNYLNYIPSSRRVYDKETFESRNGNDKLKVVFKIENHPLFYNCALVNITPLHKIWGIWLKCKRTISADVYAEWRYSNGGLARTKSGFYTESNRKSFGISADLNFMTTYIDAGSFVNIDGWADTPSVPVCYCY